ncbi:TFIIB-type zinc ribbon-containing protein [Tropicibacter oceani]|uniref:Zf-TFIIB domain-containing protein n=1 Tax=Tropicibacter oceani TaxID=3058420 RepID=A0ABY8QLH4_9RHOB|nr:zf-TFIIB domain-containing protein [Tropicibacter oceani]WGW05409.1 zf-TFIIB domain-containing protein [Tropicibacter oceani]
MKCPVDGTDLVITDRTGVEIDYCPTCRGVWLDRGELDKIIERAASYAVPPAPQSQDVYEDTVSRSEGAPRKRGGIADILGDIFDF